MYLSLSPRPPWRIECEKRSGRHGEDRQDRPVLGQVRQSGRMWNRRGIALFWRWDALHNRGEIDGPYATLHEDAAGSRESSPGHLQVPCRLRPQHGLHLLEGRNEASKDAEIRCGWQLARARLTFVRSCRVARSRNHQHGVGAAPRRASDLAGLCPARRFGSRERGQERPDKNSVGGLIWSALC